MSGSSTFYAPASSLSTSNKGTSSKTNVLIYAGPGVSQPCLLHLRASLRSLLSTRYDVLSVSAESLIRDPWTENCALLAFPGGRDLGYLNSLGEAGCKRIRDWLHDQGGRYLGLCAGAYFASGSVEFELGRQGFEVRGERPLRFYPGKCSGTAFPGFIYDSEDGARDALIGLEGALWRQAWESHPPSLAVYYNGGGYFEEVDDSSTTLLARYLELPRQPPAGLLCRVGEEGKALLWAVHPEHPSVAPVQSNPSIEEPRTKLLRATLKLLDLELPEEKRAITGPTPAFLTALDPAEAEELASQIQSAFSSSPALIDAHDIIYLHRQQDTHDIFALHDGVDHNRVDVIVCSSSPPSSSLTPIFNLAAFQSALQQARKRLSFPFRPSYGSPMLYGEVVTSTQTVLEKNPKLLSALPTGFVFVGSHQIAGRGRGQNSWLSPPGCLQFSLVLRAEQKMGPKLVYLQYIFGLSVVEAVRSLPRYEDVELRLKWPNDIYVDLGAEAGLKKIGGILVNSFYAGGDFTVIVGCGINTTNSSPTTSLLDLIQAHNAARGSRLPIISQEELLAHILPRFEAFWAHFEREGSFAGLSELYTRRWLHSDKVVTIQESGQQVRIVGLTPEYGLLRTVSVDSPAGAPQYIDLEPDGNSFDMMQGLLKVKR